MLGSLWSMLATTTAALILPDTNVDVSLKKNNMYVHPRVSAVNAAKKGFTSDLHLEQENQESEELANEELANIFEDTDVNWPKAGRVKQAQSSMELFQKRKLN